MKAFAELYKNLDETTKTNAKVKALVDYFEKASPEDAVWAINFLIGRKPKQIIPTRKIHEWAIEEAGIPEWLFYESYDAVGDLAETITLLLPRPEQSTNIPLSVWVKERLLPLRSMKPDEQHTKLISFWREMDNMQRFVYNKLITGAFRVGVSQNLVVKALSKFTNVDEATISHRLMGNWDPNIKFYNSLIASETSDADVSKPYPFFLAYPLEGEVEELGNISEWQAEWKWDGIRSQLIKRNNQIFLWSRGEDLITDRFPEITGTLEFLPDGTVIDGEVMGWKDNSPLPFAYLQQRIGRKTLTKKVLDEVPAAVIAYDVLEYKGEDIRSTNLVDRRKILVNLVESLSNPFLVISPEVKVINWEELKRLRQDCRSRGVEGVMLKRLESPYRVGRRRGDWWKWKIDPLTVDAVLIYAQRGSGKRASLYTDYTFGIWDGNELVPFAKAYSGLNDEEIRRVDSFVRRNTMEKFGPVRTVKPELVFELAFEGIQKSTRHKSGIAVRFPRISRWRTDKKAEEADTIETVRSLLNH